MFKYFAYFLLALSVGACNEDTVQKKILIVATNINNMNGRANGTYLIELAIPFQKFTREGYEVDIMSPKGGSIPIYHSGDTSEMVKQIINSEAYLKKTKNSKKPSEIDESDYAAVLIPGGYGQFWDTHSDQNILQKIATIYDAGGAIGTVGHGTATLIDVTLSSGEYLVKGVTMTSFPSESERSYMEQSNFGTLLPYDMEKELLKRGANLQIYDPETRLNFEVIDSKNRIATASFASGGKFVSNEIIKFIE